MEKLSNVFNFLHTNSFSRSYLELLETRQDERICNIHYGDIHSTYTEPILDMTENKNVPIILEDIELPLNSVLLRDGDVVMADASEDYDGVGVTIELKNLNKQKVVGGLHTFALRDNKGLTQAGFRTYIFKHPTVSKSIKVIATGSKVYGISKTNLAKINLILPPLPEQQKIAQILTTWDNAINKLQQLITQKQNLKKGLMQKLLTGDIRLRSATGKRFTEEWEDVRLGEVAIKKSSNLSANSLVGNEGVYKVYGASGYLKSIDYYKEDEEYIAIVKDGAGVGRTILCDKESSVLGTLDIIKSKSNDSLSFLHLLLMRIRFEKYIIGSTIPHIYFKDYSTAIIKLPSIKEQQKIASVLTAADKEIETLQTQLELFKTQKKGLMQQLLTGKTRVKLN